MRGNRATLFGKSSKTKQDCYLQINREKYWGRKGNIR